jgi:transposase
MTEQNYPNKNYPILGIDVSKKQLDVCVLHADEQRMSLTVKNTPAGHEKLMQWLKKQNVEPAAAGLESTGVYSAGIAVFLHEQGMVVYLANPSQVHSYMRAEMRRAKTDKADAEAIANFIAAMFKKLHPWEPIPEHYQELRDLVRYLHEITRSRASIKNRIDKMDYMTSKAKERILRLIKSDLAHYEKEIGMIKKDIQKCIRKHPDLTARYERATSAPGIGEITAVTYMSEVPNFKLFSCAKKLVAYAGISPRISHSGIRHPVSQPISKMGNATLRQAVYMGALTAKRHNQSMTGFATRLRDDGKKKPKVVTVAVARKLLHLLYAMDKNQTSFDPNYQKKHQLKGTI